MARFDVYANPDESEHKHTPYVLDIQNDHLRGVETRLVIPLRDARFHGRRLERVHPAFTVNAREVVLDTPTMATFPREWLHTPVTNLLAHQLDIQDALDTLFGAY